MFNLIMISEMLVFLGDQFLIIIDTLPNNNI